jgi:hypothetical protein
MVNPIASFTTKCAKDTKVSDIDIFKLLNFVLFVTFVVNTLSHKPLRTSILDWDRNP